MVLSMDFETASAVDLVGQGLKNYAMDPSTRVWCMAYRFDRGPVKLWRGPGVPGFPQGDPFPLQVIEHVKAGGAVRAFNAAFEWNIWNEVLVRQTHGVVPKLSIEQVYCTMFDGLALALPRSLENMAVAMQTKTNKDPVGKQIMLKLCVPKGRHTNGDWVWQDGAADFEVLYRYCRIDVLVECELADKIPQVDGWLRRLWIENHRVNSAGVYVDPTLIGRLKDVVAVQKESFNAAIFEATGGAVEKCTQNKRFKDWLATQGIALESVGKDIRREMLAEKSMFPAAAMNALEIWDMAAFSSTAKLEKAENLQYQNRIYNSYIAHAAATGRFGGAGVQPQNLTRPPKGWSRKDALHVFELASLPQASALDAIAMYYGNPVQAISSSLRAIFKAMPGHLLVSSDLASIESRTLAWQAGEEWKLQAHRDADAGRSKDVYCAVYAKSFGVPIETVDDYMRQIGKVEDLALGYQGGNGAFSNMAKVYGVKLSDDQIDKAIKAFREAHQKTKQYWYALEKAFVDAVRYKGRMFKAGPVVFQVDTSLDVLFATLPSGRRLAYPYPGINIVANQYRQGQMKAIPTYMAVDTKTKKWSEQETYGGCLAENMTQAIAFDVFAHGMLLAASRGLKIVMHTHDEITCEVPYNQASDALVVLVECMMTVPKWAEGLPLNSKGWINEHYWK